MEKFKMVTYQREYREENNQSLDSIRRLFRMSQIRDIALLFCLSFLLGRAAILDGMLPFGAGFFTYFLIKDKKYSYLGAGVFIGIMTSGIKIGIWKYIIMIFLSIAIFTFIREKIRQKIFYMASLSSAILFVSGLIPLFKRGLYIYDLVILGFESTIVFVFVYILSYAMPILMQRNNRNTISNEELVCTSILVAIAVSGFSNIMIAGYSIKKICGLFLTIVFAHYGGVGVGTSIGITIGLISGMSGPGMPALIAIYGFSGLLAGVFRELGKFGSGIGMLLGNIIISFYMYRSAEMVVQLQEIIFASAIFIFMPKFVMTYVEKFINTGVNRLEQDHGQRVREIIHQRIKKYGYAFSELADTYGNMAEKDKIIDQNEIAKIVDQVATRLCSTCGMCRSCWNTNFYNTYQGIVDVLYRLESHEKINLNNVPDVFKKRCIKINSLICEIQDSYNIYHIHYEWHKKLFESRQLISEQFQGISETLTGLADEIAGRIRFHTQLEEDIYIAMDKAEIFIDSATVLEKENGQLEIEIGARPCFNRMRCQENIIPIISELLGKSLVRKNRNCSIGKDSGMCTFVLTEAKKYQIATGVARVSKDYNGDSGDSFSIVDLPDAKTMMILSDGMGSGDKASQESSMTVAVLEQLMDAGFNKELAIRTVNSILVTKSSEEIFSTMDLSIIDQYTGKVEFVKVGAAPSFIKRKNGTVEIIKSTSLPIGILDKVDIESFGKNLESGDFLIILSDGVLDAEKERGHQEEWVAAALEKFTDRNPQSIADKLLDIAIKKYQNDIKDDMTILVAKVWETR